jgi:hypothetical protein
LRNAVQANHRRVADLLYNRVEDLFVNSHCA